MRHPAEKIWNIAPPNTDEYTGKRECDSFLWAHEAGEILHRETFGSASDFSLRTTESYVRDLLRLSPTL